MDTTKMLEVVEADEKQRVGLAAIMRKVYTDYDAPWLKEGARSGDYKILQLKRAGVALCAVWYWVSPSDKALIVNAVASFVSEDIFEDLNTGVEALARLLGCTKLVLGTARAGLVPKLTAAGFVAEEVRFTKMI